MKRIFLTLTIILCLTGCSTVMDWVKNGEGDYTPSGASLSRCPICNSHPNKSAILLGDEYGHVWTNSVSTKSNH